MITRSSRPGAVSLEVVLPGEARIMASFFDDGSVRDITGMVADLLLEFLLRPADPASEDGLEGVQVMEIHLTRSSWEDCLLVLRDEDSDAEERIPGASIPVLVAGAMAMAIADATSSD